ncbi:efflux RND transporter periplasmic adaptor subunit [Anthocerotibacter panamensis]|uniref:efflux RND transporter periplasmic adaptor subunit n=1 Tax=Anthocerotibacter panamensis TaxID=2857077 RepID=UPI001C405B24|nr:efflux RND transporter periplasmic adaptor subunit [Anthocerotibacter panamensis]
MAQMDAKKPIAFRKLPLLAGLGLALLTGSYVLLQPKSSPLAADAAQEETAKAVPPVLTVRTAPAAMTPMVKSLSVSGSVAPWQELTVGTMTGGLRIERVLVEEGDHVTKGQVLAVLNSDVLRAQLAQAQARYQNALAQVRQQRALAKQNQARFAESQANYHSYEELYKAGALSELDLRTRRTTFDANRAQGDQDTQTLAVAQSVVAEARANVQQLQAQLSTTQVVAPDNGWILRRDASIGSISATTVPLFSMARQSRLELNAQVPETDLPGLVVGQRVTLVSDADPDLKATGQTRKIGPQVDATSRQAVVKVALDPNPRLRPGMFVRAQVTLNKVNALTIPAQAVSVRNNTAQVFVLAGNQARLRTVTVGDRSAERIEVKTGLKSGEQVITAGGGYLKDGDVVKVTSLKS